MVLLDRVTLFLLPCMMYVFMNTPLENFVIGLGSWVPFGSAMMGIATKSCWTVFVFGLWFIIVDTKLIRSTGGECSRANWVRFS